MKQEQNFGHIGSANCSCEHCTAIRRDWYCECPVCRRVRHERAARLVRAARGGAASDPMPAIDTLLALSPEPTHRQALEIYDSLNEAYHRLMDVRRTLPVEDFSTDVWRLMGMVGIKARPVIMMDAGDEL